ncbi:hypothetical protein [Streptomyces sp. NPDC046887]|uniref:hypothetical protein n=1 Tax=Streptomyces sp. NPDC046887 TaxID=3155472 RepID=UPI0033DCF623
MTENVRPRPTQVPGYDGAIPGHERSTPSRPGGIPGYDGGPLTHHPEYLDEPLFWLGHLGSCAAHDPQAQELLFGADYEAAEAFHGRLWERADWPVFTVPLAAGHRLHIVYRTLEGDGGIDYLLHHPSWPEAELLASDDGHFSGPGLSWPELAEAAGSELPGGCTGDPDARLLLLLPALGDHDIPEAAVARLAAALRARTGTQAPPEEVATALLAGQGRPGPAVWTVYGDGEGVRVNDGAYSRRNPANPFALPPERLARVSAALTPGRGR